MSKKKLVFTLNDETKKNSYGFRVKTDGISLERFKQNPICLNDHENTTKAVLGKWVDIQTNNTLLTATPEFDTKDTDGAEVVRKVQNGTLKGCSMGMYFNPDDLQIIDGELWLLKCELYEASIVAVPSNANSISLYSEDGNRLTDKEVKQLCLRAKNYQFKHKQMEELKEIVAHLQLKTGANAGEVLVAIKGLEAKLTASENKNEELKAKIQELQDKETVKLRAEFETELENAVKDGRLDADGKPAIVELAEKSYAKGISLLKALPKRNKVSDNIKTEEAVLASYDQMTWEQLDKGNHLEKLKLNHNDYYVERFKKQFGTDPK
ncbi:MAG: HK97 family phage prohead protease [Tenacibaculum sp.]|nr:HK97 family phage prohead protease [Tenacibaculum sp.]